jgi:hypothetical protein
MGNAIESSVRSSVMLRDDDDLMQKPSLVQTNHASVVIGDMHGNVLKLLHFLVKHGVVDITDDTYNEFASLHQARYLDRAKIARLCEIIYNLSFDRNAPYLRLMGDELCDRGKNDYLTLYLLAMLDNAGVPFEIYQSNHTLDFTLGMEDYLKEGRDRITPPVLRHGHARSLQGLNESLGSGLISKEDLQAVVNTHKKHQRLVGYSLNEHGITLYSHAPTDLHTLKALAKKFNLPFNDQTPIQLALTIEHINKKYTEHVTANTLHELIDINILYAGYGGNAIDPKSHPLEYIFWNRQYGSLKRSDRHETQQYQTKYAHGHDSADPSADATHIISIDSLFGKSDFDRTGYAHDAYGSAFVENPIYHTDEYSLSKTSIARLEQAIRDGEDLAIVEDEIIQQEREQAELKIALRHKRWIEHKYQPVVTDLLNLCRDYKAHLTRRLESAEAEELDTLNNKLSKISELENILESPDDTSSSMEKIQLFQKAFQGCKADLNDTTAPAKAFLRGVLVLLAKIITLGNAFKDKPYLFFGSHGKLTSTRVDEVINNTALPPRKA